MTALHTTHQKLKTTEVLLETKWVILSHVAFYFDNDIEKCYSDLSPEHLG